MICRLQERTPRSPSRREASWYSSRARSPKIYRESSLAVAISRRRRVRCLAISGRALAAAGARPEQVTRITIYVVNYKRDECLPIIEKARIALFGDHKPADVVLGVATLSPDYLIEVDAIAIID